MRRKRLTRSFFVRDTLLVAEQLLGKVLIRKIHNRYLSGRIVEVEAYIGEEDLACHASRGRTTRTEVMFGKAGCAYIYLIYGMYYCFNIVTEKKDFPAAILIRALEPLEGKEQMMQYRHNQNLHALTNGPGKMCQALAIDTQLNGEDVCESKKLFIVDDGFRVEKKEILQSTRIGVDYAGASALYPWRYYLRNSEFVSRKKY
jgi:DNA-3-methyladenine glycosylase